jgi:tRNA(fMet)-specific endonuclease VapC
LLDAGRPVPLTDLMIAATAIHHDLTMVTHNVADYTAVPGLRIQDWLSP